MGRNKFCTWSVARGYEDPTKPTNLSVWRQMTHTPDPDQSCEPLDLTIPFALPGWEYWTDPRFTLTVQRLQRARLGRGKMKMRKAIGLLEKADSQVRVYDGSSDWRLRFLADRLLSREQRMDPETVSREDMIRVLEKTDRGRRFQRFMLLPEELRNRIYVFHFESLRTGVQAFYHPTPPPLAQVNRHIRAECLQHFWTTQTFYIASLPVAGHDSTAVLSEWDKKWLHRVVGDRIPMLRSLMITCPPDQDSTEVPIVQVSFDKKMKKAVSDYKGVWKAELGAPYGMQLGKKADPDVGAYVRKRLESVNNQSGLVMSEEVLVALVGCVGPIRYANNYGDAVLAEASLEAEVSDVEMGSVVREASPTAEVSDIEMASEADIKQEYVEMVLAYRTMKAPELEELTR